MKIHSLDINHINLNLIRTQIEQVKAVTWTTLPPKAPFVTRAIKVYTDLNINLNQITNGEENQMKLSPWANLNEMINLEVLPTKKNNLDPICANQHFQYLSQDKYEDRIKIFTDGSKQDNTTVGSATYIETTSEIFSWKLHSAHTILMCLSWYYNTLQNKSPVIFTDSHTALRLIMNINKPSYKSIISKLHQLIMNIKIMWKNIVLQWIPPHKGLRGNNIADQIAKQACSYNTTTNIEFEFEETSIYYSRKSKKTQTLNG